VRKLFRGAAAVIGVLTLSLAGAGSAQATGPTWTSTATIKSSPDDNCPAWARDTFVRTTVITPLGEDTFKVTIADKGTFTTNPTAAGIKGKATGALVGSGEFTVSGELRNQVALKALNDKAFNLAGFACKANVPADKTTGNWPKQFFKDGAKVSGISPWRWTYTTACETKVESSVASENSGAMTGKVCPAVITTVAATCANAKAAVKVFNPNSHAKLSVRFNTGPTWHVKAGATQVHAFDAGSVQVKVDGRNIGVPYRYKPPTGCVTASPTVSPTVEPGPTVTATATTEPTATVPASPTSAAPVPTQPGMDLTGNDTSTGGLPVTGTAIAGIGGVALLLVGAGGVAYLFTRRRSTRFTA
jgi:hypothetical protein